MIDFSILKKFGSTNDRMRRVFTSKEEDDYDDEGNKKPESECIYSWREKWENRIYEDIYEGIQFNLRNYYIFASADLAWDGNIINKEIVPYMLYAQGKLKFEGFLDRLKECGCDDADLEKICGKPDEDGNFHEDGVGRLIEMPVNLVRSLIQRRAAAQISKYVDQYPLFKYDTYSRSYVAQLRADAMTQRAEIMSNQYEYRKQLEQTIRDFLLYPFFVEFPAQNWHCEKQYRKGIAGEPEPYIVREGVPFVRPHPSRVSYDISSPLSSINSNTGCGHIFYWDVCKWGDIKGNTNYFNRDKIVYNDDFHSLLNGNFPYFDFYYATDYPCRMEFPTCEDDVAGENDRERNIGYYSGLAEDTPVVLTEYRKKIIPKDWGLGDYPYEVWVRLVVAGEKTVVYGEFLPSNPAVYYGFNVNDNRLFNIAFSHEVMPWQDQATRIQTQMMATMQQSLLKILLINTSLIKNPSDRQMLHQILRSGKYTSKPIEVEVNFDDAEEVGQSLEAMKLVEAQQNQDSSTMTRTLVQLISLAERTLNFSPQEQGQPAPREISATEVLEIANTTNTVYNYISNGIDFGNAAKKRIIYESTVALSKGEVMIPITQRYPSGVVENAGFRLIDESEDEMGVESAEQNPAQQTIIGTADRLEYDYIFNSRTGSQRISDSNILQSLNSLVQLLLVPQIMELVGPQKITEAVSAIFRAAGVPLDIDMDPESQQRARQQVGQGAQMSEAIAQAGRAIGELSMATNENAQNLAEIMAVVQQLVGEVSRLETGQSTAGGPQQPVSQFDLDQGPELPIRTMAPNTPVGARTADPFAQ